jgi:hypothetical protein
VACAEGARARKSVLSLYEERESAVKRIFRNCFADLTIKPSRIKVRAEIRKTAAAHITDYPF